MASEQLQLSLPARPNRLPAPGVNYAEPVFDKFGNPSCRPGDVPIGGAYTIDLPLCPVIGGAPVNVVLAEVDDDTDSNGVIVVPDDPVDDPTGGNQTQNQSQDQNNNQNQNQNSNQSG